MVSVDRILAIDASGESCSVALLEAGQTLLRECSEPRTHAQALLPMIDSLLSEAKLELANLNAIALIHGPGSFTGIRIALSITQGLAYASGLPVICLSSLFCMAHKASLSLCPDDVIVSALDARMSELYWAAYRVGDCSVEELVAPQARNYADFNASVNELSCRDRGEFIGAGEAWQLQDIDTHYANFSIRAGIAPNASALLGALASIDDLSHLKQRADGIEPLYVRNEVAWQKRQRIRESR